MCACPRFVDLRCHSVGVEFYFAKTPPAYPLLALQSLAGADPGYPSLAQLCRPAAVRLSIPGCTFVRGEVEGG